MKRETIVTGVWQSPCGRLVLGAYGDRLCMCDWGRDSVARRLSRLLDAEIAEGESVLIRVAVSQLEEYFSGKRKLFDLPLVMPGSKFQQSVWSALCGIGYGDTLTYKELASEIGMPSAVRAVANAAGANALSIIVPCHRVIGADSKLTGYAGGIDAKSRLLDLECVYR